MTVNANLSTQSPFTAVRSNSVQDSLPLAAKAFEALNKKPEQDLFQALPNRQNSNLASHLRFAGNQPLIQTNYDSSTPHNAAMTQPDHFTDKQKENFQIVHEEFKKTAKLAAPDATQQECEAWVDAGDKAMLDSVGVFQKAFQKTHDKASAQMVTSNYAANAFIPNLLATPDGRNFLLKASQNIAKQQTQSPV